MEPQLSGERELLPGVPVPFRPLKRPSDPAALSTPLSPGRQLLARGYVHTKGARPLADGIVLDRDVEIAMRDGVVLRGDIYRAPGDVGGEGAAQDVPLATILAFTPYGKSGAYWNLDLFPFRAGVPKGALSGLQSFEAPDPDAWVRHGYSVVVVDTRGSFNSEGDLHWWGRQAAEDGYDVVEWIAAQPWSNGRVGMTGNSQLAMIQWATAAVRPPHLAAIAPWEGLCDHYNDNLVAGGIPFPGFSDDVAEHAYGNGSLEAMTDMLASHPFYDDYWASKAARLEDIEAPAYVVASITNPLHTKGTLDAFRRMNADRTWLRVHNAMEWPDYYEPDHVADLRRFFDRYLKEDANGWETTPKVRYTVLDLGGSDVVDRPSATWPPSNVEHRRLLLDASSRTLRTAPAAKAVASYDATDVKDAAVFDLVADADVELVGYGSVQLWVSTADADDMDLFVLLEKLNKRGRPQIRLLMQPPRKLIERVMTWAYRRGLAKAGFVFWPGPGGRLRVSRRELDARRSTPAEPRHLHRQDLAVPRDEPVLVEIPLWPMSIKVRVGETLRLTVRGQDPRGAWFPDVKPVGTINIGAHRIHTGNDYASSVLLPFHSGDPLS